MRYYVYISRSKIDMLYPQIDAGMTKKIKSTLEASVPGVFKAAREEERLAGAQPTDYVSRLALIEAFMKKSWPHVSPGEVGGIMCGSFLARAFHYSRNSILFVGKESGQVIALSGSRDHLVGSRPTAAGDAKDGQFLPSFGQHVLGVIEDMGRQHDPGWDVESAGDMLEARSATTRADAPAWVRVLDAYVRNENGPPAQRFEFLAYQFVGSPGYWLGTPLFLAQGADPR